jgi:hypothetical protein
MADAEHKAALGRYVRVAITRGDATRDIHRRRRQYLALLFAPRSCLSARNLLRNLLALVEMACGSLLRQQPHDFIDAFVAGQAFFVEEFTHARAEFRGDAAHEIGHLLA